MPTSETHDVRVEMSSLRELFQAPELDPLSGRSHYDSGLVRILNEVRPRPRRPFSATIVLPARERTADIESRTRAALQDYCAIRIEQQQHDKLSLRHEGLATLLRGLGFLALCLLASQLLGEPKYLHPVVARFLDEGFIIAGWVALWYPLDTLLYEHWPLTREIRLYEQLRVMPLRFEFVD